MVDLVNKEVTWSVLGIPIYGTIIAPADGKRYPAIVFVAGSGPTDRDWCSPLLPGTNGSGKLLAEALAKEGFVTLRYDKVASGPHVRENIPKLIGKISMQSHLEELAGAVEALESQENVDKNNIFALTNSEGAIHAVNYQLQTTNSHFKGLVLTGAPGRAIGEVSRSQIYSQIKQLPNADSIMKLYDNSVADFTAGKPMAIDPSLPEGIQMLLKSLETPVNLPFSRELWMYSLPQNIAKINESILVLIGKKDIQVDWKVDGAELEKTALNKTNLSFVYPENANHVLKHEPKTKEELTAQYVGLHYNAPDAELDVEVVDAILGWLKRQVQS
jgi:pimeloyl-ACP methyl ester carboxylesterase